MSIFLLTSLFIFLYLVRPFEFVPALQGASVILPTLVLPLVLLGWRVASGDVRIMRNGADQMVVGMMAAIMLSHIANGWIGGAIQSAQDFLPIFGAYFLITHGIDSQKKLNGLINVLIFCAAIIAVEGYRAFYDGISYFGVKPLDIQGNLRIVWLGPFADPNDLGMLFVLVIPMLLHRVVESKGIVSMLLLLLLLKAVLLTNSRGTMLAVLVSVMAYFLMRTKNSKGVIVGAIIAVVLAILGPSRMSDMSAGEESAHGRLEAWYEGFLMLQSHPAFGVGMGGFTDYHHLTAHNSFVLAFAELGFLGGLCFVGLFYFPIRYSYILFKNKVSSQSISDEGYKYYCVATATLIGIMVTILFLSRTYMLLPYMAVAFCMSGARIFGISDEVDTCHSGKALPVVLMRQHTKQIFLVALAMLLSIYSVIKLTM